jgi:K+-transporting ATPase ATPase C chain
MLRQLGTCLWLLAVTVVPCSVVYPLVLWAVGQTVFPHQAEGSLVDAAGKPVTDPAQARGSHLIAQAFKGPEFFQPRPSSAGYDASASGASNWAASNVLLRSRVARALGPIVRYADNSPKKPGQLVGEEVEQWFHDQCQADKKYVAKWAADHAAIAERYVNENPEAVAAWLKQYGTDLPDYRGKTDEEAVALVKADNAAAAKLFFTRFADKHPGKWPGVENQKVEAKEKADDIKGYFFDLWLQDNPRAVLQKVPADMVMASGSGLDPHITLENARWQLKNRVAREQAKKIMDAVKKPLPVIEDKITKAVEAILRDQAEAPLFGLAGVDLVNVLELNMALKARMEQLVKELQ